VPAAETIVVPACSAFSLAAARLGWPLERTALVSLHGRPIARLALHVAPDARLLILAEDAETPAAVAAWLVDHGFGGSRMIALAHMGGAKEARFAAKASEWDHDVPDFHTLAVACVAGPDARWYPRAAGLPDDAFRHDGKLTKRAVRALALAKLRPRGGARLWDVGAGCGSVGIEWMRAADFAPAIALEPRADRRTLAAENALALGVPELDIRDVVAPEGLAALPDPDAIFVGGGVTAETLDACMARLKPGGAVVAHAVTLESEAVLLAMRGERGGTLTRLAVSEAEPIGGFTGWRPAMPVTQWAWEKT
jgi:precorrin-6Y C5,15-methyltransferase (decarboxylating)